MRPMTRSELELCLIEMTEEKNECTTKIRDLGLRIHALEKTETRLKVELDLMKKNASKRHDTSQVCYKCKGKSDVGASSSGDILIKLKEENEKLKSEKMSLVSRYKNLVRGHDKFNEMLYVSSSQHGKNGIGFPPVNDMCRPKLAPKGANA